MRSLTPPEYAVMRAIGDDRFATDEEMELIRQLQAIGRVAFDYSYPGCTVIRLTAAGREAMRVYEALVVVEVA